jgi:hypothetical protein
MAHRLTEEEKVAKKIANIVSDLRLDLNQIGRSLAWQSPTVSLNRLILIVDAMEYEKDKNVRQYHKL